MCNNSDSLKSGIISRMQEERTLYLKASSLKDTQYEILKIENKEVSTLNLKLIEDKSKFFRRGFRNVLITAVLSSVATIFILK
jgi:DNA polymerase III delta prime subunit